LARELEARAGAADHARSFVRPFRRVGGKNDANDAEAICTAVVNEHALRDASRCRAAALMSRPRPPGLIEERTASTTASRWLAEFRAVFAASVAVSSGPGQRWLVTMAVKRSGAAELAALLEIA